MHPRTSLVRSVTIPLVLALVGATACTRESESADVALAVEAIGTCPSGAHECAAWGASCAGDTLRTCVFDVDGCRKLIAEPCSLGCASPSATNATCATCNALAEPKRSSSSGVSSTFYKDVVRDGNVAIALWRGRNGIYEEARGGFATIDLTNPDALKTLTTTTFTSNEDVRSLRIEGHRLYGIAAAPRWQGRYHWPHSIPQFDQYIGPAQAAVDALAPEGVVAVANWRAGVGIPDVLRRAELVARELISGL